jgi:hypothetical protein
MSAPHAHGPIRNPDAHLVRGKKASACLNYSVSGRTKDDDPVQKVKIISIIQSAGWSAPCIP